MYTEVGQDWHMRGQRVLEMTREELLQAIVYLVNVNEALKKREYESLLRIIHST